MVEMKLQQDIKQTLELLLSPRLMQMLKVLNLSYADLVEHIAKQAEENPVLEVERQDEYVEFINYLNSDRKIKKQADFEEMPGLENISKTAKTLEQHLLDQLELEDLDEQYHTMATLIIENIDDFGLVINYPALRDKIMKQLDVSRPTVDKALKIVQGLEPEGVGARDMTECLLIQISAHNFENKELETLLKKAVKNHLNDFAEKNYKKIAQEMDLTETAVSEIANFIKHNLNPNPGSAFGQEVRSVIPSFAIEKQGQGFKLINLEQRYGPQIKISPHYLKMLEDPATDEKTKEFIRDKIKAAKELMEDFDKRSETLLRIIKKIVDTQTDFLSQGTSWLKPLTQKSLADEFGLHPSTISRSVAEKYIQTPKGMFPLKFLCPLGPKGATVSRIKLLLEEILKLENADKPLSDSQIAEQMLNKGIDIDRRTVAYYRKEMKVKNFEERKKHA